MFLIIVQYIINLIFTMMATSVTGLEDVKIVERHRRQKCKEMFIFLMLWGWLNIFIILIGSTKFKLK